MKNFFRLIAGLAFLVMVSTAFVACSNGVDSSDDGSALSQSASNAKGGSSSIDAAILGTWDYENKPAGENYYIFNADGTYTSYEKVSGASDLNESGTFAASNNWLTLRPSGKGIKSYQYSFSGSKLTIKYPQTTLSYNKR